MFQTSNCRSPPSQDIEDPVTVVVELDTLRHVRLHSKGARDCAKLQAWAIEAEFLGQNKARFEP